MNIFLQTFTLILFFAGVIAFIVAGWLLNTIVGLLVLGSALILTAFIVSPGTK